MPIFERASREKLQFTTPRGNLAVEDLWDLPLQAKHAGQLNLDEIAVALYNEVEQTKVGIQSFVNNTPVEDSILKLKLDIVTHIIKVRMAEADVKTKEQGRLMKRRQLRELIMSKENEALSSKTVEELQGMMDELDK